MSIPITTLAAWIAAFIVVTGLPGMPAPDPCRRRRVSDPRDRQGEIESTVILTRDATGDSPDGG